MKRLRLWVSCALIPVMFCGCAAFGKSSARSSENLQVTQITDSSSAEKPAQVCLLDPAAYAQQSAEHIVATDCSPVAEVSETSYDFGAVSDEKELVHQFSVKNTGKSVLNIKKVLPG